MPRLQHLSSGDRNGRFMPVDRRMPFRLSAFWRHLDHLGLTHPARPDPERLIRRGWLRPLFTLPAEKTGSGDAPSRIDLWLGDRLASFKGDWWLADLDRVDDPDTAAILAAGREPTVPQAGEEEDWHADRIEVYRYHQAFLVADLQERCTSRSDPLACDLDGAHAALQSNQQRQAREAAAVQKDWSDIAPVLDRVSLWRTAVSTHAFPGLMPADGSDAWVWADAEADLLARDAETGAAWEEDIRAAYLTTWERWRRMLPGGPLASPKLVGLFRQDVQHAIAAAETTTGQRVDFLDETWDHGRPWHADASRGRRSWAKLLEVLPFEEDVAMVEFPVRARTYLRDLQHVAWRRLDETDLFQAVSPVRHRPLVNRFLLSFRRTHEDLDVSLSSDPGAVLPAKERITSINQTLLDLEKALIAWSIRVTNPAKEPDLKKCVKQLLGFMLDQQGHPDGEIATRKGQLEKLCEGRSGSKAHITGTLPLIDLADAPQAPPALQEFFIASVNFLVGRNHAAHSSSVDRSIIYVQEDEEREKHVGGRILTGALVVFMELTAALAEEAGAAAGGAGGEAYS